MSACKSFPSPARPRVCSLPPRDFSPAWPLNSRCGSVRLRLREMFRSRIRFTDVRCSGPLFRGHAGVLFLTLKKRCGASARSISSGTGACTASLTATAAGTSLEQLCLAQLFLAATPWQLCLLELPLAAVSARAPLGSCVC